MPDVTSIDLSSAKRREDEDEEQLREQAAARDVQARSGLDAALKLAHGDPDKIREIVLKQRALGKRDPDESQRELASNDPPPLRADNLDATSPDARKALDDHIRKGVLDAGGATPPASVPMGTPVLDLAPRADTMTRQQVETQLALTKEAMASPGVMLSPILSIQIASRLSDLRQRLAELSPPMPDPKTFPEAGALWREQGKQQRFLDSAEGKQATPEERDAHARYAARLGDEAEARIRAWEASPTGQEAAKQKLYESIHKLDPHSVCRAGDTVDSLREQYTKLVAAKTPPPPDPDTTIYLDPNGEGTLDRLALNALRDRWEKGQAEINSIHGGPLGTAGSLAGLALGLSDEQRRALAKTGALGDMAVLSLGAYGKETDRLRQFTFEGEQRAAGRTDLETAHVTAFFSRTAVQTGYWSDIMSGFDPASRVESLPEDLRVVTYFSDPSRERGRWVTEEPLADPRNDLALPDSNQATSKKDWVVPQGTLVLRGTCAPLNSRPGGGSQIFLPNPNVLREP